MTKPFYMLVLRLTALILGFLHAAFAVFSLGSALALADQLPGVPFDNTWIGLIVTFLISAVIAFVAAAVEWD